jgi:putative hydrolase of the HAD superfamily
MSTMQRFFDYPVSLWSYFRQVDVRLSNQNVPEPVPANVNPQITDLSGVRAVFWDVYGTLCGVSVGDLQRTLEYDDRLAQAAGAVIKEFQLIPALTQLYPDRSADIALRDRYLELIAESHERSRAVGIECPEVVIEQIWQWILEDCRRVGYESGFNEPLLDTAYRAAYFFDASIQHNYLYPGIADCLSKLSEAHLVQGIISNAQFYTPIQLRRLLREELHRDRVELEDFFDESLVFFSYELGYSKPNQGAFQKAIDILQQQRIKPEEIVYIGNDMLNDVWAAARAGWRTILFAVDATQTTLRSDEPNCTQLQPDAIVTKAESLMDMFAITRGRPERAR